MTERRELEAPVVAVRVLEDRAFVRREAAVALEQGLTRWRITGVAPVVVDKTLEVRVEGATLAASRVRRARVAKDDATGAHAERVRELEEARRAHSAIVVTHETKQTELADVIASKALLCAELAEDVGWGRAELAAAGAALDALIAREDALRAELAELAARRRKAERVLADRSEREAAARHPATHRRTWIELDLDAGAAAEARVHVAYLVPNAVWRPRHRATLRGESLEVETEAIVWQRTGEDWDGVSLTLSTERPSLGVHPPTLETDRVTARRKPERVEVETRAQVVATTGLGRDEAVAAEVPGVDDGGETRELAAEGRVRVPSDGRPHRTSLGRATTPATVDRVLAAPSPFVILRARATHAGALPLLAGPVVLVGQSGPIGETELRFVAPGDRFELGFGPDAAVRVVREEERLATETKLLSSWVRTTTVVKNKLSHVGDTPARFELVERVPVSEIPDVEIELDVEGSTAGARLDADGFVRWDVTLAPSSTKTIELRWVLAKKSHVQGV
ncbi:MAG: mucoidy inhibitor MuiA family protein [Myxococcales bacterium]|nr:mucoidy inhibitor MuiA family protein [Myxococcales bacterium]